MRLHEVKDVEKQAKRSGAFPPLKAVAEERARARGARERGWWRRWFP